MVTLKYATTQYLWIVFHHTESLNNMNTFTTHIMYEASYQSTPQNQTMLICCDMSYSSPVEVHEWWWVCLLPACHSHHWHKQDSDADHHDSSQYTHRDDCIRCWHWRCWDKHDLTHLIDQNSSCYIHLQKRTREKKRVLSVSMKWSQLNEAMKFLA